MQTMTDLLTQELEELLASERYFLGVASQIHDYMTSSCLRDALERQGEQKRVHVMRLQCAFDYLAHSPHEAPCKALRDLLEEAIRRAPYIENPVTREVYLMGVKQKSEHLTIVSYCLARDYALHLGQEEVADMMEDTLAEKQTVELQLALMVKPPEHRPALMRYSIGA